MTPDALKQFVAGKKTYLAVIIGLLYLLGVWIGAWPFDDKILDAIGLGGLAFLRMTLTKTAQNIEHVHEHVEAIQADVQAVKAKEP